jgi:hypothetical protein
MRRVLRYAVPIDGCAHYHELTGDIVHVAAREAAGAMNSIEFWAIDICGLRPVKREFVVVPTGIEYPHHWKHLGTAIDPTGTLVWHLMEVPK